MSDCLNIFGHIENPKHKLLLRIAYGAGLRRSEIIALRRTDIRFDGHKITVRHPKNNKDREVMLPYSIVEYLKPY
jgi:integrase